MLILTKFKVACIAVMLVFTLTSAFIANKLWGDLQNRNERISFLEARLNENSEEFSKLQNSCYATQKISEEASIMSEQMARNADELQAEIDRLRARIPQNTPFLENVGAISDEQPKDIPTHGVTNENGKQGQKPRNSPPTKGNANPRLDPDLVRVLNSAYCSATNDSVHCTAK